MLIKINRKDIPNVSNTPIFTYCRKLIAEGIDCNTRLEIYREKEEWDVCILNIGEASKLTVKEAPRVHFEKYVPYGSRRGEEALASPSLVR